MGQNVKHSVVFKENSLIVNGKVVADCIKCEFQTPRVFIEFEPITDEGVRLEPVAIVGDYNIKGVAAPTISIIGEELNRKLNFSFQVSMVLKPLLKFRIISKLGTKSINKDVTNIMDALPIFAKLFKGLK